MAEKDSVDNVCDTFDALLQRMKTDMMYELRNIQHEHRPVTGQENRETLQQFMTKHICDPEKSKGNVPANVDDVAQHRPQSIVVEVQGMVEQRPVSSALQSVAFRNRLESIIRGGLQSARQNRAVSSPLSSRAVSISREGAVIQPSQENQLQVESVGNISSPPVAITEPASAPIPLPRISTLSPPQRTSPVLDQPLSESQSQEETGIGITWNDISRVHREEIVQEISELLHTRLVSSTLEGEFRATLEVLFEEHVDSNGPAVEQFVQSLPGRGIPRNDFSHLGIETANGVDNSDNISIASFSTHSVPYTQTNTFIGREIQGLKSQMKEMMSMIKMTHELQLDIQRSIRQEVAAALAHCLSGEGTSSQAVGEGHVKLAKPVQDTHCLICLDRHSDSVLYQCGHMCVCYLCGKDLVSRKHWCPVCRAPIKDVIRAYKTNVE